MLKNITQLLRENYILQYVILVLILFTIIVIRAPEATLLPIMRVEDGTMIYSYFHHCRHPLEIFRHKAGYMPLIPNIIGYFSAPLPPTLVPYYYAWIPLLIALTAYSIFFSRKYRTYVPSDALRFFICIGIALNPFAAHHFTSNVDYSIWNLLLILTFLSAVRFPNKLKTPYFIVYVLLICSHPLSILILPWLLYAIYKDRTNRTYYVLLIFILFCYAFWGASTGNPVKDGNFISKFIIAIKAYTSQFVMVSMYGLHAYEYFYNNFAFFPYLFFIIFILALYYVFKKQGITISMLFLSFYYTFLTLLASILCRSSEVNNFLSKGTIRKTYSYITYIFCTMVIISLLFFFITSFLTKLRFSYTKARIYAALIITGYFALLNLPNSRAYYTSIEEGLKIKNFFQEYQTAIVKNNGRRAGIKLLLMRVKPDGTNWPIIIDNP